MIDLPGLGFYLVDIFDCPPFKMFTAGDCPLAVYILQEKAFEPTSMKLWCRYAREATGILDIGAHVGTYSLVAASLRPDLIIHAYEPNPYAFARLRLHKTINGFENIEENRFALADRNGISHFSWYRKPGLPISSGGGLGRPTDVMEGIYVETRNLDDTPVASMIGDRPLVKIDTEGAEAIVLANMSHVMAKRPDVIFESFSEKACNAITDLVLPMGYRIYKIWEDEGRLESLERAQPADFAVRNYNQLLTTRPIPE